MDSISFGTIFLYILRAVELLCICFFLSNVKKRQKSTVAFAAVTMLFAFLLGISRLAVYSIPDIESEFFYITFAYYLLLLVFILVQYRISLKNGIFILMLVFLSIHALRQTVMRISTLLHGMNYLGFSDNPGLIVFRILYIAVFAFALCVTFSIVKKRIHIENEKTRTQLAWMVVTIIPVFYMTNLGLAMGFDQTTLPLTSALVGQISGYCGLVAVIGYENALNLGQKERELARMEAMLLSQSEQFRMKKETVDILNRKYHDLKNHLLYVNLEGSGAVREEYVKSLEDEIRSYESLQDTGNEALDVILTNKGLLCAQRDIRLLLFLDGRLLSFLKPLSIATIFGNALDNAMEALETMEESKREITVRVSETETWCVLRFENYYKGVLVWEDERLLSTKPDAASHGTGIKNIEAAVLEYGGNVSIDADAERFALNILLPRANTGN